MTRRILVLGALLAAIAAARRLAPHAARTLRRARSEPIRAAVTVQGDRGALEARIVESGIREPPREVRLRDAGARGTVVEVVEPPPADGPLGAALAPFARVRIGARRKEELRRLKQLVEAGEAATIDGQPSGREAVHRASSAGGAMRALVWRGRGDVRVEEVPDPTILNPRDAIVRVTSTAICGSDLHLYSGFVPTLRSGDILGHEFMGEVVEVGRGVTNLAVGDRVIVPAVIACGACFFCRRELWSCCDNSNPHAALAEAAYGYSAAGIFGYSHAFGGYAGGQAEYVRVPFADVGPYPVPPELPDESVLFLTDIFPTGYQAALLAEIEPGDTVAVWGCGPVGQFAIRSAFVLGAERVIAIDRFPERLAMAAAGGAETIDYVEVGDVVEELKVRTGGMGPDACIDAVGSEAHTANPLGIAERALQAARIQLDRPHVLREVIQACRKGGRVSLAGVYGGFVNGVPMGALFNKGLSLRAGQVHVHRYRQQLLDHVVSGGIDPSFVITHRLPLADAPRGYEMFQKKEDGCIKVVLYPDGAVG